MSIIIIVLFTACTAPKRFETLETTEGPSEVLVAEPEETAIEPVPEIGEIEENETAPEPVAQLREKTIDCKEGLRICKDNRLIECRKGKLLQKEKCGLRGCFTDHCGECVPDTIECIGSKLVTCTKDGRKLAKDCFRCINNECEEAPSEPEPFPCSEVEEASITDPSVLLSYSPFKKDYVEQELVLLNQDGNELGRLNHKGGFFTEPGSRRGIFPIYAELDKCYFQCVLPVPLEISIRCEDHKTVTAYIPSNIGFIRNPTKFFISKDGSTYYGDSKHNGEGDRLTIEQAFTEEHLAMQKP